MISCLQNLQSFVQIRFENALEIEISLMDKDSLKNLSLTIKAIVKNVISGEFSAQIKQVFEGVALYEQMVS